ncbi:hypothetical protein [Salinicola avicenniae]|uniref:hypothetical protein n=1 Tax=Salinicola avicenniae TaxID=2916836 RepID=UPI002073DA51|nr:MULTISPECIES: hypothetical protein [unclassified Salinicola]
MPEPVAARSDYDSHRLRLVDGVALTPAGFVAPGSLPDPHTPQLSTSLHGADGFRLLVHEVAEVAPVRLSRLARLEAKALRLHELLQTIVIEALMMLEALPEDASFDVLLSAPLRSREAADLLQSQLRQAIEETQYGEALGDIYQQAPRPDPHDSLSVGEHGGMPWVLWFSVDSLLNAEDVNALERGRRLGQSTRGAGLYPGEAVSALLIQRLLPEETAAAPGWLLGRATTQEHAARAGQRERDRRRALQTLLAQAWPVGDDNTQQETPTRMVVDALGLPGRAVEVGGALVEHWPELDMIEDGLGIDQFCGWPGGAVNALAWVLLMASLQPSEHGVVLGIEPETTTRVWSLLACAEATAQAGSHS